MKENNLSKNAEQRSSASAARSKLVEKQLQEAFSELRLIGWIKGKMDVLLNNPTRFTGIKWKMLKRYVIVCAYDNRLKTYRIWRYDTIEQYESEVE